MVYGCSWEQVVGVPLGFCLLEARRVKTSLETPDRPILGPSRASDQFLPVSSFWVTSMKCLSPVPGGPFTGWSVNYGVNYSLGTSVGALHLNAKRYLDFQ